jgi:CBS domain-containing protein
MSTVQQILAMKSPGAVTMNGDETVLNAALMMDRLEVGALVVTDVAGIGIFTERDLLRRVVAKQCDPATTLLRDVMTTPVATCRPETSLLECRAALEGRGIRHLPVVDNGGICGLITNRDITAFIKEHGS